LKLTQIYRSVVRMRRTSQSGDVAKAMTSAPIKRDRAAKKVGARIRGGPQGTAPQREKLQ